MIEFSGTVLRIEPEGFGIVVLDPPIEGRKYGMFATSVSQNIPYDGLRAGRCVKGNGELIGNDIVTIRTMEIETESGNGP